MRGSKHFTKLQTKTRREPQHSPSLCSSQRCAGAAQPVVGSEQGKIRPCVVTSDAKVVRQSRAKLLYTVVPLTHGQTLIGPLAPRLSAREGGTPSDGVALVMHVRTVDPARVVGYVGELTADEYTPIKQGLAVLFGLEGAA